MAAVPPYKLIPLATAIQPRQRFEYEMADFLNNDSISDSEKSLLFQSAMSRLQKYRNDMTIPIKVDVVPKPSLPLEPQPSGPLVSRRDPTAVNQNLGPCAVPVNQNHGPGVVEPFSPQASTQDYEGLFEKLPVSYRQSAQLLYHHLHELNGFENERGFNNIKINDKLYNATDLLTDLISNRKLFVKPLKNKHGSEVSKQLEQVFSEQTFKKVHVARGKEFLNPSVKKTLEKYQIELYHTIVISKLQYKDPSKRLGTKITLPKNNWYNTIPEIIKDMNNLVYTGKDSVNFHYNKLYDRVYILGLEVGESCYLSDGLREVLGYKENIIEPEPDNIFTRLMALKDH
ncbi:hypothetical protein QYM36_018149 [Artemia franciscana]|uniref:Uncharacterized protein n=1 Tax=Artemia franciscana TaxID=6661 RepID=A0AA88H2Y2_ARTSF|nr:hypothetical protein QYM36_018149 [Artemia franciscana]